MAGNETLGVGLQGRNSSLPQHYISQSIQAFGLKVRATHCK
jgi:hypothetical protein